MSKKNNNKKKGKNKKKQKGRIRDFVIVFVLMIGFLILNYPAISNLYNQYRQSLLISDYNESISGLDEKELEKLWQEAVDYNERLARKGQLTYQDAFSETSSNKNAEYKRLLNVSGDGVMGSIEIPKINVYLSVSHGLSDKVLEKGIGHMTGSSLPVGGTTSHCILAGHRGLPSAELFTDLDQMEDGDEFYLHILNHTLKYKVDEIKVVLPEEVNGIYLEEGKDYVTLVTCTPYGVNSHRLLIRGARVPIDDEETVTGSPIHSMLDWLLKEKILLLSIVIIIVLIVGTLIKSLKKANKKKKKALQKKKGKSE